MKQLIKDYFIFLIYQSTLLDKIIFFCVVSLVIAVGVDLLK